MDALEGIALARLRDVLIECTPNDVEHRARTGCRDLACERYPFLAKYHRKYLVREVLGDLGAFDTKELSAVEDSLVRTSSDFVRTSSDCDLGLRVLASR